MEKSKNTENTALRDRPSRRSIAETQPALPPTPEAERLAVVVLTMHRSGSSALARILNLLGCDAPKSLISADGNNESGYWESDVLRVFNDDVLASAGTSWRDWQAFNADWYTTPRFPEFLSRGQELLAAEYGSSAFFFFKDPRICRCVPLWRKLLVGAGVEPRVIMSVRHPIEVAQSLAARDGIPEAEAVLMWLRHMLDAEHDSRGLKRAFVSYDRLVSAPTDTMAALQDPLGLRWPRLSERVAVEVDGSMTSKLRHHQVEDQDTVSRNHILHDLLSQVHGIFLRWSRDGEDVADHESLDEFRADMTRLSTPLRTLVEALSAHSQDLSKKTATVNALKEEGHTMGGDLNAARKALSALKEEHAALQKTLEEARAEREAKDAENQALQNELDGNRSTLVSVEKDMAQLEKELLQRDEKINALQADLHRMRSALEQRSHEAEETAKALKEAEARIEKQKQEAECLRTNLATAETAARQLDERERALDRLRERTAELDQEVTSQAGDLARMAQLIIEKEEALKRRNAAAHEASDQTAALQQDIMRLKEELEARSRALTEAEAHRRALLDSTSWRITAPLRRLILFMKR